MGAPRSDIYLQQCYLGSVSGPQTNSCRKSTLLAALTTEAFTRKSAGVGCAGLRCTALIIDEAQTFLQLISSFILIY